MLTIYVCMYVYMYVYVYMYLSLTLSYGLVGLVGSLQSGLYHRVILACLLL